MGVSVTEYALLYSIYSWPNVILSVFGGYLIDRVFGVRVGTLVFSTFVTLGQVLQLRWAASGAVLYLSLHCSWCLPLGHLWTSTG